MFALISSNNLVVQIEASEFPVAPPLAWVDISSASPAPEVGWTLSGSTFTAPASPPALSLAQQAVVALSAGLAVTSTGTPAINGTYALDLESRSDIMAEIVSLLKNSTFTNGTTTLPFTDISGALHDFQVTVFEALATEIGNYVGALKAIIASNSGTLPAAPAPLP